jgi:tetratricopeptide (TPR) repeat protein
MEQEGHPDRIAQPAQAALDYYRGHGFSEGTMGAGILLIRAKREEGQYRQALDDGNALLSLARQSGLSMPMSQAEEAVGAVYQALQQYPTALLHFQSALQRANSDKLRAFQALHCGVVDIDLGRFEDATEMFAVASQNPSTAAAARENVAQSLLRQQQYRPALQKIHATLALQQIDERVQRNLRRDQALAEAHLSQKAPSLADLTAYIAAVPDGDRPETEAQNQLISAEVYLWLAMNRQAVDNATAAQHYFEGAGLLSSSLRGAYIAEAAAKNLKDRATQELFKKKVLDIRGKLQQNWGSGPFQTYISRPDLHALAARTSP